MSHDLEMRQAYAWSTACGFRWPQPILINVASGVGFGMYHMKS